MYTIHVDKTVQAEWKVLSSGIMFTLPEFLLPLFFLDFIYSFFRERGQGERKEEKHQCVVASRVPPIGDLAHTTQACALTRNQTSNPLVRRPALNTLSHTSQGYFHILEVLRT